MRGFSARELLRIMSLYALVGLMSSQCIMADNQQSLSASTGLGLLGEQLSL